MWTLFIPFSLMDDMNAGVIGSICSCSIGERVSMDEYGFDDALVMNSVTCSYPGLEAVSVAKAEIVPCESLFFPGCSFLNYAMPLVQSTYDLLRDAGQVDGISLLCCGKILEYEGDGGAHRSEFEQQFRDHIAKTSIKRIVAACPNCVLALRKLLRADEATAGIEVVPLPTVLTEMGYRVDPDTAASVVYNDGRIEEGTPITFCPKDSCPDRATGEFADGLRSIMENTSMVEPKFARKRSYCCGSRPRAAGHYDLGDKMARRQGTHAQEAGANALVTACISCTFSILGSGCEVPVFHYLELLFGLNIPWYYAQGYLKLRFLFENSEAARESTRGYMGIE